MEDFEKDRLTICPPDHDGEISVELDGPDCLGCVFVFFEDLENWVKAVRAEIDGKAVTSRDEIIKAKIKHWQRIKANTLPGDREEEAYAEGMVDGLGVVARIEG